MAAWPLRNVFQVIQSSVVLEREPQECRALKQLKRRKENAQVAQVFSRPFFQLCKHKVNEVMKHIENHLHTPSNEHPKGEPAAIPSLLRSVPDVGGQQLSPELGSW